MLEPELITLTPRTLVTMSLAANRTGLLWQRFMPYRKEIVNAVHD